MYKENKRLDFFSPSQKYSQVFLFGYFFEMKFKQSILQDK
jgi:hypothetical protein